MGAREGTRRPRRRGVGGAFSLREGCIHFIKNYILYINGGGFNFNSIFLIFLIPGIRVEKYTTLGDSECNTVGCINLDSIKGSRV